jgi:alpha-N-arabinofuranosidase
VKPALVQALLALPLLALPLLAACAAAPPASAPRILPQAAQGAEDSDMQATYNNPILPGFYPDPSICRVGGDYYLVTSSFEYFPGVPIFHSKDLVNWRQLGHVLTRDSQLRLKGVKSSQGIFAPTIRYHAGTFYMVTTNVSDGGGFYVTATDPAGPWSDPVWLKEPVFTMDPSLTFTDDGHVYYARHSGLERGGAYQAELDPATGQLQGEPQLLWRGTGGIWPEGPHLYAIDGRYYLMLAEGGTSTGHSITIARSSSPFGPFEPYAHNPILTHSNRPSEPIQATGHGDLVQAADGRWWMVLLGIRRWDGQHHHLGRETFLAPVSFGADGWPVVNGGAPLSLEMSAAGLPPPHPWPEAATRDDFDASALALDWNFLRQSLPDSWSLSARPGHLRLSGSSVSLDEVGTPAFVGRRQRHFRASFRAALDFTPTSATQRAGLTLRANEANHHDLVLTGAPGARRAQLWTRSEEKASVLAAEEPVADGLVELEIEAFADRYEFFVNGPGARRSLGRAPTAALSSEAAGGFTGVYVGMFATTSGEGPMPPADFDWFEYAARD